MPSSVHRPRPEESSPASQVRWQSSPANPSAHLSHESPAHPLLHSHPPSAMQRPCPLHLTFHEHSESHFNPATSFEQLWQVDPAIPVTHAQVPLPISRPPRHLSLPSSRFAHLPATTILASEFHSTRQTSSDDTSMTSSGRMSQSGPALSAAQLSQCSPAHPSEHKHLPSDEHLP